MSPQDLIYLTFIPPKILFWLKLISGLISVSMFVAMIFFVNRTGWLTTRYGQDFKEFLSFKPSESRRYERMWKKITQRLNKDTESEYKLAIIEADNLLISIFEKLGYKGETSVAKLRSIPPDIIQDFKSIEEARKVRNNIIYDVDYRIDRDAAGKIIEIYEKTMQELGVFG